MSAATVYRDLTRKVLQRRSGIPLMVVGINGITGSGKTTLARALAESLEREGIPTCQVSVDDFHHPKDHRYRKGSTSPEGYYRDSINFGALVEGVLRPAFEARRFPVRCQTKHLDLERDEEAHQFASLPEGGVLLAEGVFLFRPELTRFMHLLIYVHADVEVILERVKQRDLHLMGSGEAVMARYSEKYLPGERLYHDEVSPREMADFLLDNTDPANPILTGPWRSGVSGTDARN